MFFHHFYDWTTIFPCRCAVLSKNTVVSEKDFDWNGKLNACIRTILTGVWGNLSKEMDSSDVEDDPEPFISSGEDWSESEKKPAAKGGRAKRNIKKPRKSLKISGSSDSEEEKTEHKSNKNSINKKRKISPSSEKTNTAPLKKGTGKTVKSNNFAVGSFVVSKKEAQVGDPSKQPFIWRIDGKSLLQKFEPIEHEGKKRHKNTSIYTGWSPLDMDDYAPITIEVIEQHGLNIIVELQSEQLKCIINDDSD